MVLDFIVKAFFSILDLLKGSFFLAIIAFVFVFIASFFHVWLVKKFNFSWLKATMITSYLAIFILIMLLYCFPVFLGFQESDQGVVPAIYSMTISDWIVFIAMILVRNLVIALLFAFFVLPLEFFASFVFDFVGEKAKLNNWIKIFVAVFATCVLTAIICLYLLPWIVPGLVYLTFYWHL